MSANKTMNKNMTKNPAKRTQGQKKILASATQVSHRPIAKATERSDDEAIARQFQRIQRGYALLMNEVIKEYDLIKHWLGKEAQQYTSDWKGRMDGFLSKH